MANIVYIVDYDELVKLAVPTFLRRTKMYAYLKSLITPIKELYNGFVVYKTDAIYRVSHNGSITLLQKVLNDKFDNAQRRIYIKNVQQQDALRFYSLAASKELGFYTHAFGVKNGFSHLLEFNPDAADFTVHIPIEYQSVDETELNKFLIKVKAQLDYYKLYAKKYKIEWIS